MGFSFTQIWQKYILNWAVEHGWKIIGIVVGAVVVNFVLEFFIDRAVRHAVRGGRGLSKEAEKKREDTLIRVFSATIRIIVWILAGMMVLSEFGLNIAPIIAAAGVAGLAFGFGGQYLIRDVISGFFIIMENQYRVGDVVCFGDVCGLVEDINLRLTILRDLDGTVHHVPNGEIKQASNLSKYFSRVNLDVGISYGANLEKVIEVIDQVGRELADDPDWKEMIISPPKFLRVDDFADSAVIVKILGDTAPLKQWDVTGELRKRLKIAFDQEGIEIPFPQRVIHQTKNT
jgi:small-conductance mechanosensitive channel